MKWTKAMMAAAWTVGLGYASPVLGDCQTDDDCGAGRMCVINEYELPCEDYDIECDADDDGCLAKVEEMRRACEESTTKVESYCTAAPCETDADCGDEMECVEFVNEWCGSADIAVCDDGEDCTLPAPAEPECGREVIKECAYKYEAGCEEDADCGEGFTCEEIEACSCGVTDTDEDGDPAAIDSINVRIIPDEEMPDCSCEPTGNKECRMKEIECESDDDCPTGTFCDDAESVESCTESSDGEVECEEIFLARHCYPEGDVNDDDGLTQKESDTDGDVPNKEENAGDTESVIGIDDDATDNENQSNADSTSADGGAGGCTVVAPAAGGSTMGALLGLLSLMGFAWRRR